MTVNLRFCGAAGTVTGSCNLIRHVDGAFLVDCGLFQGTKTLKQLNYQEFPFDPSGIDFVLLTHAHIDHAGLLPKLAKAGFTGPVYCTAPTADLLAYMLPDSGHIQESEVEQLNRRNAQRGWPKVEAIYTQADAEDLLSRLRPVDTDRWTEVAPTVQARFWNAGHILGSASIEVELGTADRDQRMLRLLFSGDIGPEHKLFHRDPDAPENLDYVICESTYGNRRRARVTAEQRRTLLCREVEAALKRGGNLLIPAFAVERTQELLADLCLLFSQGRLPKVPVFLDSPLAIRATEVFHRHNAAYEVTAHGLDPFRQPNFRFTLSVEDSMAIDRLRSGAIIIAASGMCEAGRIRHHLKAHIWRPDSTVLITGFQAVGTLGRLLLEGKTEVRIHGEAFAVRATVRQLDCYSGHADAEELADWVAARQPLRRGLFLVHGEDEERKGLRQRLLDKGLPGDRIFLPQLDDEVDLLGKGGAQRRGPSRRLEPELIDRPDWHNDYAQLALDIRRALEGAADTKRRNVLLRRLRRALEE